MSSTGKHDPDRGAIYTPGNDEANNPTSGSAISKIFLTLQEASDLSGLSADYLTELIKSGGLRVIVDNTVQKIRRSDLERL